LGIVIMTPRVAHPIKWFFEKFGTSEADIRSDPIAVYSGCTVNASGPSTNSATVIAVTVLLRSARTTLKRPLPECANKRGKMQPDGRKAQTQSTYQSSIFFHG
jgi:hypothetical protein